MKVTNIEASWQRRLPREQYGHAEVQLKASAVVDDKDDAGDCCHALLVMVRNAVSAKLGIAIPNDSTDESASEPAKTGRGRKKKDDTPSTKVETKSDKKADTSDEIPDDGPEDNIKANPENRVNPDDEVPADDTPAEAVKEELVISRVDLNKWIAEMVKSKKLSIKNINEVLSSFGVARINDLADDSLIKVKTHLENVMVGD